MRTFVINLARAKDRRKAITERLNKLELPFEIWPGVDGRLLRDVDHNRFRQEHPDYHYTRSSNEGINGWVGCTRSHQSLCQHIFDTWDGPVLVLEDDAVLDSDWEERSYSALEQHPDAEILLVGCHIWPKKDQTERVYRPRLMHAYLIVTKNAAKQLADVWLDESTEGDEVWWKIMNDTPTYALLPHAAHQAGGYSYITGVTSGRTSFPDNLGIVSMAQKHLAERGF